MNVDERKYNVKDKTIWPGQLDSQVDGWNLKLHVFCWNKFFLCYLDYLKSGYIDNLINMQIKVTGWFYIFNLL